MGDLGNFSKFFLILVFDYNYYSTFEFKYVPPSWAGLLLDNRMDFFKPFVAVTSPVSRLVTAIKGLVGGLWVV